MTDYSQSGDQRKAAPENTPQSMPKICIRCAKPIETGSILCHECGTPQRRFSLWKHESWPFWLSTVTLVLIVAGLWLAIREITLLTKTTQLMDQSVQLQSQSVKQMDSTIQLARQEMALRSEELDQERETAMQRVREFIALNRPKLKVGPLNCRKNGDSWSLVLSIVNQSASRLDNLREIITYSKASRQQQPPRGVSRSLGVLAPMAGLNDIHNDIGLEQGVNFIRVDLRWEWRELHTPIVDSTYAYFSAAIADTCSCMREVESAKLKSLLGIQ